PRALRPGHRRVARTCGTGSKGRAIAGAPVTIFTPLSAAGGGVLRAGAIPQISQYERVGPVQILGRHFATLIASLPPGGGIERIAGGLWTARRTAGGSWRRSNHFARAVWLRAVMKRIAAG